MTEQQKPGVGILEGVKCPKCSNTSLFEVQGLATFTDVDGTGTNLYSDVGFLFPLSTQCRECFYESDWGEFHGIKRWACTNCGGEGNQCSELFIDNDGESRCPDCGSSEIHHIRG
jgi:hypothetical protein